MQGSHLHMNEVLKSRRNWLAIGLGLLVLSALGYFLPFGSNLHANVPPLISEVAIVPPQKVNMLHLTDHQQHSVTPERLTDHWTFVFFGYSNCPDVCPATLTQLVQMNNKIQHTPTLNGKIQFYFVSVDPQRDTIEHLADYIAYFDKSFTAMTGDESAIRDFENELGAFHRIGKQDKSGFYAVAHSAEIFLINPAGQLTAKFIPPLDLDLVIKQLGMLVEQYPTKAG